MGERRCSNLIWDLNTGHLPRNSRRPPLGYAATTPDSLSAAIARSHTMIWFQLGMLWDANPSLCAATLPKTPKTEQTRAVQITRANRFHRRPIDTAKADSAYCVGVRCSVPGACPCV